MRRKAGSKTGYRICKRAFDIVFSAGVTAVLLVPGLVLCVFVAKDTGGSPLYVQKRVGMRGKDFNILKFRTMVADADDVEKHLSADQLAQWHAERKVDDDPRITRLGRVLRATSIDEIPQFVNVLKSDMSVIGPRAITRDELEEWYSADEGEELLGIRPGITGAWQTGPRNVATFDSGRRQKLELGYVRDASPAEDVRIFFRTFKTMAGRTGQ